MYGGNSVLKLATLVVVCAALLPAASLPKPGKLKAIRKVLLSDTRKGKVMRMAFGFAATTGTLVFRPGAGSPLPPGRAAVVITPGTPQFGCAGCVGPDWSNGKP